MASGYSIYWAMRGYLPEGEVYYAETPQELAELLAQELNDAADYLAETADMAGEREDYREAWLTHKAAEQADILRRNLDNDRQNAPVYRGKPELWAETIMQIARDEFPASFHGMSASLCWDYCEEIPADDEEEDY
jgi:hypothetical protein